MAAMKPALTSTDQTDVQYLKSKISVVQHYDSAFPKSLFHAVDAEVVALCILKMLHQGHLTFWFDASHFLPAVGSDFLPCVRRCSRAQGFQSFGAREGLTSSHSLISST